jgi:hypothetical protein
VEVPQFRAGDRVRVRGTPATLAADLAGLIGEVQESTRQSSSEDQLIGELKGSEPVEVHFADLGTSFWFSPYLLEPVSSGAGKAESDPMPSLPKRRPR